MPAHRADWFVHPFDKWPGLALSVMKKDLLARPISEVSAATN